MKVLIVEDSRPMRELLKIMLCGVAEVIGECADGAEALTEYMRLRPDWTLMDIELPRVDGISATRQITSQFPDARIVIVTNFNDASLQNATREAGASGFVLKDDLQPLLSILQNG